MFGLRVVSLRRQAREHAWLMDVGAIGERYRVLDMIAQQTADCEDCKECRTLNWVADEIVRTK